MSNSMTVVIAAPTDPALPPPAGVVPDFRDPFSLRPYNNVSTSLSLVITGFFIVLRLYTKIRIVKQLRWEDCVPTS